MDGTDDGGMRTAAVARDGDVPSPAEPPGTPPAAAVTGATAAPPDQHPLVQDLMLNPSRWRIWPAVAVLRWLQRLMRKTTVPRMVFRSHPSLGFATSEVKDILLKEDHIDIVLNAPGLAAAGSPLPASDIARIIADNQGAGALGPWLDGPCDRFMHILEDVQMRSDPAYALLAGGRIEAFELARDLVGRSAPLNAKRNGELYDADTQPQGAVALAALFVGPTSASGLRGLIHALTGLNVRIDEFAGAEVDIARPARIGEPAGLMLGTRCRLPAAGVEIHIEGGDRPESRAWATDAPRRASLYLLATSYIGAPSPAARVYLWLDGDNTPPAALDDATALGGLAVLGGSDKPVRLPLAGPGADR
ncbi:MAG: type VI secretion system baseplate subunit TssG [Gammaproteobacteria bacterium]|nr:type VI secretion system baseplate subunit TssG [Gammaproteobacteria bacterium]